MATRSTTSPLAMLKRIANPSLLAKNTSGSYTSNDYLASIDSDARANLQVATAMGKDSRGAQRIIRNTGREQLDEVGYQRLQADLKNPLYIAQAQKLGITKFNTSNDMARVIESLTMPGKKAAPAPAQDGGGKKEPDPTTNEATEKLRNVVKEQIKQNEDNRKLYEGMMNDLTARLLAAEQTQPPPPGGGGVQVGAPGTNQTGTTPEVSTTTTKPITRRKKPGLEIEAAPATGASLTI